MATIDFITYINDGSKLYAEFLKKTAKAFRSDEHTLNWKCMLSGNTKDIPNGYKVIGRTKKSHISSSYNHALAINKSLECIESDYVVIIDADIAILYPKWDNVIIKALQDYDCFGFNRPREHFPTVFMFCFKKELLNKVKLDFLPAVNEEEETVHRHYIKRIEEAEYRHSNIGALVKHDTGWRLPIILKGNGKNLDCVLSRSPLCKLPFSSEGQKKICLKKPEHMCEWHYDGKIFGTHKQASRVHLFDGFYGRIWRKRINTYLEKEFGLILNT